VEGIELFESHKGGLKGLVVGEVITCIQHPNADRLRLTTVNIGTDELLSIVCGAPNVAVGQKVIVATIGTTLYPSSGESFMIKESKIRGELSQGMLCAEDEIGLPPLCPPEAGRTGQELGEGFAAESVPINRNQQHPATFFRMRSVLDTGYPILEVPHHGTVASVDTNHPIASA
jgi:tRNA-binding EMAP/Myf-like protein